jgi:hypothetical protein
MKKHAFLIKWHRVGRTVTPVLDAHTSCVWPLGPEDQDTVAAKALIAMIDGHGNLPSDVKNFLNTFFALRLRLRYQSGDVTGPYIINDVDEILDAEGLDSWVQNASDEELARYHFAAHTVNRRKHARR